MIATILRISWLNLKRDRVALGLVFVLPVVFFSIFAVIFGGMSGGGGGGGGGSGAMRVIAVDEDGTETSRRFIQALDDQDALTISTAPRATDDDPAPGPYTRETAQRQVRTGRFPAAVIVPNGFGADFGSFGGGTQAAVELVHDPSNPLARHTVAGLIQASAMMAAPDILMERGIEQLERFGSALTPGQRSAIDDLLPVLRGDASFDDRTGDGSPDPDDATESEGVGAFTGLVTVETRSAREGEREEAGAADKQDSIIPYYAAGIGVMFLLFSMAGAAGALLEEEETGTLERLLTSSLGMGTLIGGHWLFFTLVGILQLVVMFVWGALLFDLDLFTAKHLTGFTAMSLVTATAAAAFGIFLATICRSRAQLSGLSTIVILIMSALGGSMVPRFIMPDFMNTTALFTFNGWALDGYLKVFWYDDPDAGVLRSLAVLLPQVAVLAGMTVVFLAIARFMARRWEVV